MLVVTDPHEAELAVLLEAICADGSDEAIIRALALDPNWTLLTEMALQHGVAGLLCRRVLDSMGHGLPDELRAAWAPTSQAAQSGTGLRLRNS